MATKLAGRTIVASRAGLKAVGGLQARGAKARPTLGITGTAVATVAELVTLWSPPSWGTLTGAVATPPAWRTLALIRSHTAAMDTLLGTEWDTGPSALVVTPTALQAWAGIHLDHLTVHSPVDNRRLGTGVGVLPGPVAGLSWEQAEGAQVGLLSGRGEAFPKGTDIGIVGVECPSQTQGYSQEQEGTKWHCRGLR